MVVVPRHEEAHERLQVLQPVRGDVVVEPPRPLLECPEEPLRGVPLPEGYVEPLQAVPARAHDTRPSVNEVMSPHAGEMGIIYTTYQQARHIS